MNEHLFPDELDELPTTEQLEETAAEDAEIERLVESGTMSREDAEANVRGVNLFTREW